MTRTTEHLDARYGKDAKKYSQFYYKPFNVPFERLSTPPEITVNSDDCLDAATNGLKTWKVNMIAVAGMNSPRLVIEDGKEKIAPEFVEGVKNKIRTIFRIAIDRGKKILSWAHSRQVVARILVLESIFSSNEVALNKKIKKHTE